MIGWVLDHPVLTGVGLLCVSAWFGAGIWLIRDTNKAARETQMQTSMGRRIPPRSPAREKRGL